MAQVLHIYYKRGVLFPCLLNKSNVCNIPVGQIHTDAQPGSTERYFTHFHNEDLTTYPPVKQKCPTGYASMRAITTVVA